MDFTPSPQEEAGGNEILSDGAVFHRSRLATVAIHREIVERQDA